jgi:hypothetical protein
MYNAIHITTQILPGGKIEIADPELRAGEAVEVFIVRRKPAAAERRSAMDILAQAEGHRLFTDAAQVDAYLQAERDSWDR